MNNLTVTLFEETREDIKIQVYARITEIGDLMLDGVDSGDLVKKLQGDWDYEYYLTVDKSSKELLVEKLRKQDVQIIDDETLLHWIKSNYSGNSAFSSFQAFLTSEEIEFKMYVWI